MNPDTRSISVEWLENGETKGKEVRQTAWIRISFQFILHYLLCLQIDLDGILELNPQLRSNIPSITMVAQNGTNIPTTSKLARVNLTFMMSIYQVQTQLGFHVNKIVMN